MQARALAVALGIVGAASPGAAQQPESRDGVEIVGHVLQPKPREPTEETTRDLGAPEGFTIEVFAEGLVNPRMLAVAEDGTVYVTRRSVGDVVMLRDADGDGRAEVQRRVASRPQMHGIAIDGRRMYLATVNDVYVTDIGEDGTLGPLRRIIDDLPDGGQHANRTLAIGPDRMLYISVGSTCNACSETNQESATILQATLDGQFRRIFASGLRNTIGFAWEPESGALYGFDHGMDWLGDDVQQEELNRIEEGRRYGWPYVYGDGEANPSHEPPGGITPAQWAEMSAAPAMGYTPHAAPMQMAFYRGDRFPEAYRGDAFVAMRGSWNRRPPSGYEIVRVDFENGEPRAIEPFVTGFLIEDEDGGYSQLGRLAGLAVTPDGALLFSDDENGVIYRVAYGETGAIAAAPEAAETSPGEGIEPAAGTAVEQTPKRASPEMLTMSVIAGGAQPELEVSSPAIRPNGTIPSMYSEYSEGVSPALSWSAGPAGTQSYVVIVEDPDVRRPQPFLHWSVYNIPSEVHELREGLPPLPRLELPEGVLQGRNSTGRIGYFGMKPPADGIHRYYFQVFALDTVLALEPGARRPALRAAMEGHVLAEGALVGNFEKPAMVNALP